MLHFRKVSRARIKNHKVVNLMNFVILHDRKIEGGSKKKVMETATQFLVKLCMIAHACSEYSETVFLRCEKRYPDNCPNGHNPEWTQSRRTQFRMYTIPNGHNPEWTQSRMDTIPKGHHPEWTQSRKDTIPNEHLQLYSYFGV